MRALFVVAEGQESPEAELELLTHKGVAYQSQDEEGPLTRVVLGYSDAGSLLRWLRLTFPGAEAHVVGVRCQVCGAIATVNLYLLGAEPSGHWCEEHCPPDQRKEWERNRSRGALPHEQLATIEGVSYYLRSCYGFTRDEVAEALREHPYTIAAAGKNDMTIEAVAKDVQRRYREPSARLRLEQAAAAAGNPMLGEKPQ